MVRVARHPSGPRLYVAGCRVHHGSAGLAAIAAAAILRRRPLAIVGLAALAHDRRDFPFRDSNNH